MRENLSSGIVNNKDADQPGHPRSLISTFVIHSYESNISKLATSKISIFQLVSVDEQAGLCMTQSETLEDGFSHEEAQIYIHI